MNDTSGTQRSEFLAAPASYLPQPSTRHRAVLNATVASRAIIALPAAISLGIVLSSPAHAQQVVGTSNVGVSLGNTYPGVQSFTINSGTTISNTSGDGVVSGPSATTLSNSGTVIGGTSVNEYGVKMITGPSTLNNTGAITGYNGASLNDNSTIYNGITGTITGIGTGVQQAQLTHTEPGNPGGAVLNKGTIAASAGAAVVMQGGTFHNYSSGVVRGTTDGVNSALQPTNVTNNGKIIADAGAGDGSIASYGVYLGGGGTITNTSGATISGNTAAILIKSTAVAVYNNSGATITGGGFGIYSNIAGDSITNSGTITQTATAASEVHGLGTHFSAIYLANGGDISNTSTGVVNGAEYGIRSDVAAITINNSGSIGGLQAGVDLLAGGTITNSGTITSGQGAAVYDNGAITSFGNSGVISGTTYGIHEGTAGTIGVITNSGSIEAGSGTAILLANGGSVSNTALVSGGTYGIKITGAAGTITNNGTIIATSGTGVYISAHGGSLINNAGDTVSGASEGVVFHGFVGSISNAGVIKSSAGIALSFNDGGTVNNSAGATISGGIAGIGISGGAGTVTNSGVITASTGTAVLLADGGLVTNGSSISGTVNGIDITGASGSVSNAGSISGGTGGGIVLADGGNVTNASLGIITGHYGIQLTNGGSVENSGVIGGVSQGIDITNAAGTVSNTGIIGASAGPALDLGHGGFVSNSSTGTIASTGGDGVLLSGAAATLVNSGLISGTTNGIEVTGGGTITNNASATISGTQHGILGEGSPVFVLNNGTILSSAEQAVDLTAGGTVSNSSTGLISGGVNGVYITGGLGTVINTGTISTTGTHAIVLEDGGLVSNQGVVISQGTIGIEITGGAGSLNNSGNISSATAAAVQFSQGGSVTNNAGQTITGATYGIHIYGGASSITNYGTINATAGDGVVISSGTFNNAAGAVVEGTTFGLVFAGPGTGTNAGLIKDSGIAGLELGSGVSFVNAATGTITGTTGVIFSGTGSTLVNAGTISSEVSGGDAVSFSGTGVNFLTLTTGQALIGTVDGGGSDSTIALDGTGTLTNTITDFGATSALDVAPNADWTAYGNWQIATATNDGTFQPGIIGTPLNLSGNFVQNADGTLQVIVTPAATNQLLATGTAKLSGALNYTFAPGTYAAKTYPFLVTGGATTGNFTTVTYNDAPTNLLHTTTYDTNDTNLVLYDDPGSPVVAPIDSSIFSDENQQSAINAQAASASLLQKAAEGDEAGAEAAVCAAQAGTTPADVEPNKASRTEQLANAVGNAFCGAGGWIQGSGTIFNADGNANVDGYKADTAGFLAGIGRDINSQGTRLGVAVGYDESSVKTSLGSKGDIDTVRVGLYGSQPVGVFTIAGDIMYGHFDTTTSRFTGVGDAGSKESGNIWSGGLEAETLLPIAGFDIVPGAGIRIASVGAGGFSESAPGAEEAFALNAPGSSYTSVQPFLNVDLSRKYVTGNAISIMPDVSAGYVYEAGARGRAVTVDSQDGTSFQSDHLGLAGSAAELQAGVSAGKGNWALYARYTADLGGNWTDQTGEVGLRIRF